MLKAKGQKRNAKKEMNINRHNYEEFFLLYVDKELTAAQRKIVEAFVAVNPDLREEFTLIQQSTFSADLKLDKYFVAALLKPVDEETTVSEEKLLLLIDNELSAGERIAVEKAVAANAELQKELQLLLRSTLKADKSIVFPDKSLLYKEAQPARVFFMGTVARRWAAAAAIILLLGSALWLMLNKPTDSESEAVVNNPAVKTEEKKNVAAEPQNIKQNAQQTVEEKQNNVTTVAKNNTPVKKTGIVIVKNNLLNKQEQIIIQQPVQQEPIVAKVETPVIANPQNNSAFPGNKTETPTVLPVTNTANSIGYASYNNDKINEEDNNILFNEERQRRSGLKGLVKKAKRLIERKTGIQSNNSEVRFAVFAVNIQ